MEKLLYLTTNVAKMEEVRLVLEDKYGISLEILRPNFEILEIQASNCSDVAKFSAEYAANKLGRAVLKSDSGLYIDALGGLPGPYNAEFHSKIGIDKFLKLLQYESNRKARIEHCYAYCEPGKKPIVFSGGSNGIISYEKKGNIGSWHDKFYIPDGEDKTLSELREIDHLYELTYWGNAINEFANWYIIEKKLEVGKKGKL